VARQQAVSKAVVQTVSEAQATARVAPVSVQAPGNDVSWGAALSGGFEGIESFGNTPVSLTRPDAYDSAKAAVNSVLIKPVRGLLQVAAMAGANSPEMVMTAAVDVRTAQVQGELNAVIPSLGPSNLRYANPYGMGSTIEAGLDVAQVAYGGYPLVKAGVGLAGSYGRTGTVRHYAGDILAPDFVGPMPRASFVGHGELPTNATFIVPNGVRVTFYAEPGAQITNDLGQLIEANAVPGYAYKRTYNPGEIAPNPILQPVPDNWVSKNPAGMIVRTSEPTSLSNLLRPSMGECHWAACMYNPTMPGSDYLFMTVGKVKVK
jgi:hypothetical protein